jgi:hypothetical protein
MFKLNRLQGYLFAAALGAIFGFVVYFMQPVSWKGQALIRIGQITQNQNQNQNQGQSSPTIEPIPTVIERIKSRSFVHAVAERAQIKEVEALLNVDQQSGMTAKQTRNGDSVEISVIGGSSELVRAATEAVASEIVAQHDVLFKNYLADSNKELDKIDAEIKVLSKRIELATNRLSKENAAVAAILIISTQPALEFKLNRASLLREAASSSNIRRTALVAPPSIIERHLFSSIWRAGLFGALLGVFLSAVWFRWKK